MLYTKVAKSPELQNNGKLLHAVKGRTLRELVEKANELNIPREDIIQILQESGYYILLYYYGGV